MPTITVPARARFVGIECSITPQVLVFDETAPGSSVGLVRIVGDPEMKVIKVESDSGYVTCAIAASEDPGEYNIEVALAPEAPIGDLTSRLTITLTDGVLTETSMIIATGRVLRSS